MGKAGAVIYIGIALSLWFGLMHVPSVLVVFFTHKNYSILASSQYWTVSAGAIIPSLGGLVLFAALYPLFKAPGEGALAGLWFVIVGAVMMSIASARYTYRFPQFPEPSFWEAVKFGAWPHLIAAVLAIVVMVIAVIAKMRHS